MRGTSLVLAGAVALAACGGSDNGGSNNPPPANTIVVSNNQFTPSTMTVAMGETVTFDWASGAAGHNVTPWHDNSEPVPESPGAPTLLNAPQSFDVSFPTVGTFRFFCSVHGSVSNDGQLSGMAGSITVQ